MNVVQSMLSEQEARSLTDEVKQDAERLCRKLVELYDGQAHLALGYPSWGAYFEAEFGQSGRHGYRLLDAGRVLEVVASDRSVTHPNEWQARELVPLLDQPDDLRAAWNEASADGAPTALAVRQVVERVLPRRHRQPDFSKRIDEGVIPKAKALTTQRVEPDDWRIYSQTTLRRHIRVLETTQERLTELIAAAEACLGHRPTK